MVDAELLSAKKSVEKILLGNTGVTSGVGLSEANDTINVYARYYDDKSIKHIREQVGTKSDGKEIVVIPTGNVTALQCASSRTSYYRPICGGTSCGIGSIGAGTAGCIVYEPSTSERYILTNNHVAAASSSIQNKNANIGDRIYAPGCLDSGGCVYPIGSLHKYIPFDETATNFVDCAMVKPDNPNDISDEILGIGKVTGYIEPSEQLHCWKSGRTSGLTEGDITDIHATMEVSYGNTIIKFANCIITTPQGLPGDSGSALLEKSTNKVTGLLFAGSDTLTVYNRISYVLQQLNVTINPNGDIPQPQYISPGTQEYSAQSLAYVTLGMAGIIGLVPVVQHQLELAISRKF